MNNAMILSDMLNTLTVEITPTHSKILRKEMFSR